MSKIILSALCLILACGCSSEDSDENGGSGGSGSGGSPSGDSAVCKSCAQMVLTAEPDLSKACAGSSSTLVTSFVTCTCQPDVCGGAGLGCEAACQGGAIDDACKACDQTAGAGPCKTEFDACMADQ